MKRKHLIVIAVTLALTLVCVILGHIRTNTIVEHAKQEKQEMTDTMQVISSTQGVYLVVHHTDSTTFVQRLQDNDTIQ